jgi:hypothetical protein
VSVIGVGYLPLSLVFLNDTFACIRELIVSFGGGVREIWGKAQIHETGENESLLASSGICWINGFP